MIKPERERASDWVNALNRRASNLAFLCCQVHVLRLDTDKVVQLQLSAEQQRVIDLKVALESEEGIAVEEQLLSIDGSPSGPDGKILEDFRSLSHYGIEPGKEARVTLIVNTNPAFLSTHAMPSSSARQRLRCV